MQGDTLISFPPSLECELSRFLLAHYRVSYREEPHALIFSSFASMWRAGTVVFPTLVGPSLRVTTARGVVDRFEPQAPLERRLLPPDSTRAQVESDWPLFSQTLATFAAVYAYFHLLPHPEIMRGPLSAGAPDFEVTAVRGSYPVFAGLLTFLLGIDQERSVAALESVEKLVDQVEQRLRGGREYLVGERFSLSDLAFAVALAPLVLPSGYGGAIPRLDEMPATMQDVVGAMRRRPAGDFTMRIYREHRGRVEHPSTP